MKLNENLAQLFHWLGIDVPTPVMWVIAIVAAIALGILLKMALR